MVTPEQFNQRGAANLPGHLGIIISEVNGTEVHAGDIFAIGSHTIHAAVVDSHGNTASQDFTITVRDTTAPSLTTQAKDRKSVG